MLDPVLNIKAKKLPWLSVKPSIEPPKGCGSGKKEHPLRLCLRSAYSQDLEATCVVIDQIQERHATGWYLRSAAVCHVCVISMTAQGDRA